MSRIEDLRDFLDEKIALYNQKDFIPDDPICIPHSFSKKQDIEISGLFAATLAWGLRKTIISKCNELMHLMGNSPHDFVLHHSENDLKTMLSFKHRTFNTTDLLYFVVFLKRHYQKHESLESAFLMGLPDIENRLISFQKYFFDDPFAPERTQKHIATPLRNSACKRINMYLRWMVRKDNQGVDFGIWKAIATKDLICPLDVHVSRTAHKLAILNRKQNDWKAANELTAQLSVLDPNDPVKYDFALFGLGVIEKF